MAELISALICGWACIFPNQFVSIAIFLGINIKPLSQKCIPGFKPKHQVGGITLLGKLDKASV